MAGLHQSKEAPLRRLSSVNRRTLASAFWLRVVRYVSIACALSFKVSQPIGLDLGAMLSAGPCAPSGAVFSVAGWTESKRRKVAANLARIHIKHLPVAREAASSGWVDAREFRPCQLIA